MITAPLLAANTKYRPEAKLDSSSCISGSFASVGTKGANSGGRLRVIKQKSTDLVFRVGAF